ncbi:hypothetical protein CFM90_22445 (plasmid) [Ralstonia solanacearum]|nr:hypothetical protein CFM90_22445 [Ralstonia solanacearum]
MRPADGFGWTADRHRAQSRDVRAVFVSVLRRVRLCGRGRRAECFAIATASYRARCLTCMTPAMRGRAIGGLPA